MIPEEFVDFSKRFEVGFLVWILLEKPTMERTNFSITYEQIIVKPFEYDPLRLPAMGSKVTLIFANPYYTEKCEMGIVKGIFLKIGDTFVIDPHDITWTLSFNLNRYPEKIVKRWRG